MRVCLISHSDSPWTPHYARFLEERGHSVQVLSFHPRTIEGVDVRFVGSAWLGERLWAAKWVYLARVPRIRRLLREFRPDVVVATYFRSNGLVGALTRCSALVVSSRGPGDYEFWLPFGLERKLVRWIAARADRLHASSPELREALAERGVPADKIEVIPLGIDVSAFAPRSGDRPPGPLRIVCTRKHLPIYDNGTIVDALARLRDQGTDFQFRFVGTGNRLPFTRQQVRRHGLDAQVEFVGEVTAEGVRQHLTWADVFVSATLSDGAPSSLFEAMACRVYPVVTDIRANRDWLTHGETGFLFAPGDSEACAEGLGSVAASLGKLEPVLDRNRRRVEEKLDRRTGLFRLETLLAETVAGAAESSLAVGSRRKLS